MTENAPDGLKDEQQDVDELDKELLDAMRNLRRKNKKVEEYLDGLIRTSEKPPQEKSDAPTA